MKIKYIVLSGFLVCGTMLSLNVSSFEAAGFDKVYSSLSEMKAVSSTMGDEVIEEGALDGGMSYKVYKNSEGYTTAVYEAGYVGSMVDPNTSNNPYHLPNADHHLFTGDILDESLSHLFSNVNTQKITMNRTPNLKNANGMFLETTASDIDISQMTTDKVTDMTSMFSNVEASSLDLSHFDTSSATLMVNMFSGAQMTVLDLSHFNTSNVNNMTGMFSASKAEVLNVSSFDTSGVTSMMGMFNGAKATTLDLSSFDMSSVSNMRFMFSGASVNTLVLSSKFGPVEGKYKNTGLSSPPTTDSFTGNWVNVNDPSQVFTQKEFLKYRVPDGEVQTWTWQKFNPSAHTYGMLTFAQNQGVVDPSNPTVLDPTKPAEDDLKNPEGGSGGNGFKNFYINYVTDFNFNDITITGGDMEHFADPIKMDAKSFAPFIQVTDNRGVYDGWKLEVVPSEFKNDKDTLKGAELVITDGVITGNNGQSDDFKPQMGSSLKLSPGSITSVMSAEKDKGYGTWSLNFTDNEDGSFSNTAGIKAVIPVSALPKVGVTYAADLVWTLSTAPE